MTNLLTNALIGILAILQIITLCIMHTSLMSKFLIQFMRSFFLWAKKMILLPCSSVKLDKRLFYKIKIEEVELRSSSVSSAVLDVYTIEKQYKNFQLCYLLVYFFDVTLFFFRKLST